MSVVDLITFYCKRSLENVFPFVYVFPSMFMSVGEKQQIPQHATCDTTDYIHFLLKL
jgi:hypothetical protein